MLELRGVLPIVATPFTASGEVDRPSFEKLIDTLPGWGAAGLTLFGIAGEYYKLTDAERQWMAAELTRRCRSLGVHSVVSVTDHATEVAVETARRWAGMGADALMLLPPFFLKPGAAATDQHIRAVAQAVPGTPIMVQYAPEQTGVAIPPATLASIAKDLPNVGDFKIECKPPGPYITRLIEMAGGEAGGGVRVHVGNAGYNMIESFDRGAVGLMPGCSMTDLYCDILDALGTNRRDRAVDLHTTLLALLNQIRQDVEMIIRFEKHILVKRGVIANDACRRPTHQPDPYEWKMFEMLYARVQPLLKATP